MFFQFYILFLDKLSFGQNNLRWNWVPAVTMNIAIHYETRLCFFCVLWQQFDNFRTNLLQTLPRLLSLSISITPRNKLRDFLQAYSSI